MISSHGELTKREKINIYLNCWEQHIQDNYILVNEWICVCVCFSNFIQLLTNKMNVEQHVIFEINSSLSHSRCALIICKPSPLFENFYVLQAFAVSLHSAHAHYGFRRFRKIISICLEYITNVYQQYSMQYLLVFSIFIEFLWRICCQNRRKFGRFAGILYNFYFPYSIRIAFAVMAQHHSKPLFWAHGFGYMFAFAFAFMLFTYNISFTLPCYIHPFAVNLTQ